jgi:hypothetical protein
MSAALEKTRHFFFDAGGTQHLGVAAFNEYRPLGVAGVTARNTHGAQFVWTAIAWTHNVLSFHYQKTAIIR